jgi:predicted RNA binding protein YcfA (HicA-like mRNA interferase family)
MPRLSGTEVIRALRRAGFEVVRRRGSHHFLKHPDGRSTAVPVHSREVVGPGLMSKILRDVELNRSDLRAILDG